MPDVPTWSGPRAIAASADALRFIPAPGCLPAGLRVYAVGDIHGCQDQLRRLHAAIAADAEGRPTGSKMLIHLGDYIDFGPDPAGVLDLLMEGIGVPGFTVVNLMGDHERMLLDAVAGDRAAATDWLWAGGRASLESWGIDPALPRERWEQAIPAAHLAFLRSLPLSRREGDYLFVHAGIRPGTPLSRQTRQDVLTIRQPFLWSEQEHGVVVVHGHTPAPLPATTTNRIGLDTGAGTGGKLTCAVLEEDRLALISV
jgi:serine/threonine protein phosphatase 1